jgi:LuxR family maltose regulon positive regulatory protein
VRKRIVDLFRAAAASRVTLVVAPAGFGKSVAVRHFLEHDETNYVWLNFRNEHETLLGFLQGFTSAISSFAPGAVETAAAVYEQANSSKTCAADIASWLTTLLQNYSGTIVLDDLHRSGGDPRISELVAELVDRSSGSCRWIIATRDVLTLPMASWVGYGLLQRPIVYSDLLVSHNEAAEIAERAGTCFTAGELHEMLTLTQAWPVAFAFLLNASTRTTDLRLVAAGTREMVYAFLAEQVLRKLDSAEREFLFDTALFPALHTDLLEAAGYSNPGETLERVRRSTAFISSEKDGVLRYHDLFRDFLEDQLRSRGADSYKASCRKAAHVLAGSGRAIEALELFTRAGASDEILSLLDRVGFELLDLGKGDVVENAVTAIEYRETVESPVQLVILAHLCRVKGDASGAERLFVRALSAAADPTLRADIALRYVTFLCYPNQRYAEALEVLDNVSVSSVKSRAIRARCIARRAVLLSYLGRREEASRLVAFALSEVNAMDDCSPPRLTVTECAARVALNCEHFDQASLAARDLVSKTERAGLLWWTGGALNIVMQAAYDQGRISECHDALNQLLSVAKRSGLRIQFHFYLTVAYDLAMQRGDESTIQEIELQLEAESRNGVQFDASLLRVYALRSARVGQFVEAYQTASRAIYADVSSHNLLSAAHMFVYAAAGGLRSEAEASLESFNNEMATRSDLTGCSFVVCQARALAALGALLIERNGTCNRLLSSLERSREPQHPGAMQLARAVRTMYLGAETAGGCQDLDVELGKLRESVLGGYADLLEHVPLQATSQRAFAALTKVELEVLRLLSDGATSRQVAAHLRRSVFTIDTHVKSITRKLKCSGRREAIALARAHAII